MPLRASLAGSGRMRAVGFSQGCSGSALGFRADCCQITGDEASGRNEAKYATFILLNRYKIVNYCSKYCANSVAV
jgi:hypothetical protein